MSVSGCCWPDEGGNDLPAGVLSQPAMLCVWKLVEVVVGVVGVVGGVVVEEEVEKVKPG